MCSIVPASIGITLYPDDGESIGDLMRNADTAMYHAKESAGRNGIEFFTAGDECRRRRSGWSSRSDLRAGAGGTASSSCTTSRRWSTPSAGRWLASRPCCAGAIRSAALISPLKFIPIAEEIGLIERIGAWVIDGPAARSPPGTALAASGIRVAVNLSAHQLRSRELASEVARRAGAPRPVAAEALELEITESVAMDDPEQAIGQLHALRDLGVTLAIDDFGTGYSSLAYLKLLPIQVLKIDRAFVSDIETDANDAAICAATIALATSLGLKVVAEGVETEAQRAFLVGQGCDILQGYLFGKPEPADRCVGVGAGSSAGLVPSFP